jgi:hypothetical protein
MAESEDLASRIEKLIVDGQKEVLGKIDQVASDIGLVKEDIGLVKQDLNLVKQDVGWLKQELKRIDKKHDINAEAQYDLMQDVKKDVGEIKEKLEAHLRVPQAV